MVHVIKNRIPSFSSLYRALFIAHPLMSGCILLILLSFSQSPGRIAADTKTDLFLNPAQFLAGALHAWTPVFTLGQMQNQAYGYLFPQGFFFLITHYLMPMWVSGRLWWALVLCTGFAGSYLLFRHLKTDAHPLALWTGAFLYCMSVHTISTLGAISSETWPSMLAPWILLAVLSPLPRGKRWLMWIPVCLLGGVNATASLWALVPAFIYLLGWGRAQLRALFLWLLGCLICCAWWLGPLFILGRYSPPFTDYIESSYTTTRWLNLLEILRGTTSWVPFVSTERIAGYEFATQPVFIIISAVIALIGYAGLLRGPQRMLLLCFLGIIILLAGPHLLSLLDGSATPLRNLHKADLLIRLPLAFGWVVWWSSGIKKARIATFPAVALLLMCAATAPAFSGRLAPLGTYTAIPQYWKDASSWLNENAHNTRTLIVPQASFAQQNWGWTRDEVLQSLGSSPWAVRDSIPLIDPEAIRGLDGLMAVMENTDLPLSARLAPLERLSIGMILVRHDSTYNNTVNKNLADLPAEAKANGYEVHNFGGTNGIDIIVLNTQSPGYITTKEPINLAGGGEIIPLLDSLTRITATSTINTSTINTSTSASITSTTYTISDPDNASIITDTPALSARNYGSLYNSDSGYLASLDEAPDIHNKEKNYRSAARPVAVTVHGGSIRASSSSSDASSIFGADTARSLTAAVDNDPLTAWWPQVGYSGWLELSSNDAPINNPELLLRTTGRPAEITLLNGSTEQKIHISPGIDTTIPIEGGPTHQIRVYIPRGTGVTEVAFRDHPITRTVTVYTNSPHIESYLFQQLIHPTTSLIRDFQVPTPMDVVIHTEDTSTISIDGNEYKNGDSLHLEAGMHHVRTHALWVMLNRTDTHNPEVNTSVNPVYHSPYSYNSGLELNYNGEKIAAEKTDAGMASFPLPAGNTMDSETLHESIGFKADTLYHAALLLIVAYALLFFIPWGGIYYRRKAEKIQPAPILIGLLAIGFLASTAAGITILIAMLTRTLLSYFGYIPRFFSILFYWMPALLAFSILAHDPWPAETYDHAVTIATITLAWALGFHIPFSPQRNRALHSPVQSISDNDADSTSHKHD